MKLRIRCASISCVNGSKSEDRSDNQSNESAVLGLFTHEGREKLLTARTGKGHSISYSRLLKPTKPFSTAIYRSSGCGGGDSTCRGVPAIATDRDGRKNFFWRNNQQVLQVQQVSYSPPEKLFYVQEESKKRRR